MTLEAARAASKPNSSVPSYLAVCLDLFPARANADVPMNLLLMNLRLCRKEHCFMVLSKWHHGIALCEQEVALPAARKMQSEDGSASVTDHAMTGSITSGLLLNRAADCTSFQKHCSYTGAPGGAVDQLRCEDI